MLPATQANMRHRGRRKLNIFLGQDYWETPNYIHFPGIIPLENANKLNFTLIEHYPKEEW